MIARFKLLHQSMYFYYILVLLFCLNLRDLQKTISEIRGMRSQRKYYQSHSVGCNRRTYLEPQLHHWGVRHLPWNWHKSIQLQQHRIYLKLSRGLSRDQAPPIMQKTWSKSIQLSPSMLQLFQNLSLPKALIIRKLVHSLPILLPMCPWIWQA